MLPDSRGALCARRPESQHLRTGLPRLHTVVRRSLTVRKVHAPAVQSLAHNPLIIACDEFGGTSGDHARRPSVNEQLIRNAQLAIDGDRNVALFSMI